MYLKVHTIGNSSVVAICDKEILGMTLQEGNIKVQIEKDFFLGDLVDEFVIKNIITTANNVNLFGKKCIQCAIECGVVDPEKIIYLQGIPHAQIIVI